MLKDRDDIQPTSVSPVRSEITSRLVAWRSGDKAALDELMTIVYRQLHLLAAGYMSQERPDHTLSATALVHEAYLKMFSADVQPQDRAHFLAIAASMMRRILIDRARSLKRIKRGSGSQKMPLVMLETATVLLIAPNPEELLDLDQALKRLLQQDPRKARLMEMVYFGGLNCEEAAVVLEVSVPTVNRDLKMARAWLKHELSGV